MKKIITLLALFTASSFFISCGSNSIKVTSATSYPRTTSNSSNTTSTTNNTSTSSSTTTVMPPEVLILKEEYVDARVVFIGNDDLEAALKVAKAEKKPVFIDFYADWCAPCKVLDDGVFHDYDVAEFMNKNVINLKVNIEKGNGVALKASMYVSALPTLLFLDPNGNEIARRENLPLIADFKKMMKAAVWKVKNP